MSPEEIDTAIEDVELRLERVRSLYEQYFLGIERIPPAVARKDLDRRIWQLRRSQIRNTAKRFKLQTVIQRYNTFQQYWQRICREIENGTYKRHLLRAEKSQGATAPLTAAARKRLGLQSADGEKEGRAEAARKRLQGDLAAALEGDPVDEAKRAMDAVLGLGGGLGTGSRSDAPPRETPLPAREPPKPAGAAALGKLELDLDDDLFGGAGAPAASPAGKGPSAARAKPTKPAPSNAAQPTRGTTSAATAPGPTGDSPPPGPSQARRPAAKPPPAPSQARPPAAKPPPPPRRAPAEASASANAAAQARPKGPPPVPARARPPAPAQPAPKPPAQGASSDRRVADLHARLVDAKRKTNDKSQVSVDSLARSLKKAESKLRQQHGNRKIDFDVVIKNGKAVVKPILR